MRKKRGQLAIFVILGVIILGTALFLQYAVKQGNTTPDPLAGTSADQTAFDNFVRACLEKTLEQGIYDVMLQGGYYLDVPNNIPFLSINVPYYWEEEENAMPSLEDIEEALDNYVLVNLDSCFNGFSELEQLGYSVDAGMFLSDTGSFVEDSSVLSDTNFYDVVSYIDTSSVSIQLKNVFKVSKGDVAFTKDVYTGRVPINVRELYGYAEKILESQKDIPNSLPIGSISSLAYEHDFTFETIQDRETDTMIVGLVVGVPNKDPIVYTFAHKYDWSEYE